MTSPLQKFSTALGSAMPDPSKSMDAVAPTPAPVVENKVAPGQTGPRGMSPRTTYSRVNSGSPPPPDFSASKMAPPRGNEFLPQKVAQMTMTQKPSLQDMIKAAMEGTVNKASHELEAHRQFSLHNGQEPEEKTASENLEHVSTEYVSKLASALGFISNQIKESSEPGVGAGSLTVTESKDGPSVLQPGQSGHAKSSGLPAASTTQSNGMPGSASTALTTNEKVHHPAYPAEPIHNQKAPLASKHASLAVSNLAVLKKLADDHNNPAHVSAGPVAKSSGVESGEGAPSEPSDVNSQKRLIQSNEAAINYTKGQAKADPKSDVNQLLSQPALSSAHDNVLNKAFAHTGEAGVKISSVKDAVKGAQDSSIKTAAARALLSNLLLKVAAECKACEMGDCKEHDKKKKESAMGAPSTPSSASGFSADSLN